MQSGQRGCWIYHFQELKYLLRPDQGFKTLNKLYPQAWMIPISAENQICNFVCFGGIQLSGIFCNKTEMWLSDATSSQAWMQRAKNHVSTSALLTGKFLRVRKVFARLICNSSLKGPYHSAQCKPCPGKMDDFKLFASEQFNYCFDSLDTILTV